MKKRHSAGFLIGVGIGALVCAADSTQASSSKFFQAATQADFLKGEVTNLSLDSQGRLMLGPAETPELDHPSSILYFRVKDINAAHQLLLERRVQIVAPPRLIAPMPTYDLWMMGFRDTEGNIMELMSEVPRPS